MDTRLSKGMPVSARPLWQRVALFRPRLRVPPALTTLQGDGLSGGCYRGSLAERSVADVWAVLHRTRATAMVRFGDTLDAPICFFAEGILYRCEWGDLEPRAALQAVADLAEGEYSVIQRQVPRAEPNLNIPIGELLRWAQSRREAREHKPTSHGAMDASISLLM